jgi:hypothetical protein
MKTFTQLIENTTEPSADSNEDHFVHHAQMNDHHLKMCGLYMGHHEKTGDKHSGKQAEHHWDTAKHHLGEVEKKHGKLSFEIEGGTVTNDGKLASEAKLRRVYRDFNR